MKFVVDGMLGGLARWLRILGQDVRYNSNTTDNELLRIAKDENMILLTSDTELAARAKLKRVPSILITEKTEEERLARIARAFDISLNPSMATTKCPECGSSLNEASKTTVADTVPKASLRLYENFWKCNGCGKVYWQGSHWKQITQTLGNAQRIADLGT